MDIINNRYRILKKLDSPGTISIDKFLAIDLWRPDNNILLYLISRRIISDDLYNFLKEYFIYINGLDKTFFLKDYGFALLNSSANNYFPIDIDDKFYILTVEYLEKYIPLSDFIKTCSMEDVLKIVVDLCYALVYATNKGVTYTSIDMSDIFIVEQEKEFKIKIKDIVTKKLENQHSVYWAKDENVDDLNDAHKVFANLLNSILAIVRKVKQNYRKTFSEMDLKIYSCLNDIARKTVTNQNKNEDYQIYMVLQFLNKKLGTNYAMSSIPTMNYLNLKPSIVGRDYCLTEIIDGIKKVDLGYSEKSIFVIRGGLGIGKTRLLRELYFQLSLNYPNIYFNYKLKLYGCDGVWDDFLESFFLNFNSTQNMVSKESFLRTVTVLKRASTNNSLIDSYDHVKFKLLNEARNLFFKIVGSSSYFIIIDDLHLADDFTLDIFLYLATEMIKRKKIAIIFSYDESVKPYSSKFEIFLKLLMSSKISQWFGLKNLNIEETSLLTRNILMLRYVPNILGSFLYKMSKGYPLFIFEIIKGLVGSGLLYIDKLSGKWFIRKGLDRKDVIELVSENVKEALLNQINGISPEEKFTIQIISLFQSTFKKEYLYALLPYPHKKINEIFYSILSKALITEVAHFTNIEYMMVNSILKRIVYDETDYKLKREKHKEIGQLLKKYYDVGNKELIWHFEQSGDNQLKLKYYLENAEKSINNRQLKEAISNYKKALTLVTDSEKQFEILLKIVDCNNQLGNFADAKNSFSKLKKLVSLIKDKKLVATYYYRLATRAYILEDTKTVLIYIKLLEKDYANLPKSEYLLFLNSIKCMYYSLISDIQNLTACINIVLDIVGSNKAYLRYKCDVLIFLANVDCLKGRYKNAVQKYKQTKILSRQCNYIRGEFFALYNICIMYNILDADLVKAFKYIKILVHKCQTNGVVAVEIPALLQQAIMLVKLQTPKAAYKCIIEADIKAKANNIGTFKFSRILILMAINKNMHKYNEIFKIRKKIAKLLKNSIAQKKYIEQFICYYILSDVYQELYHTNISLSFVKLLLKIKNYQQEKNLSLIYSKQEICLLILKKKSDITKLVEYFTLYIKYITINFNQKKIKLMLYPCINSLVILTMLRQDIDFTDLLIKIIDCNFYTPKNFQKAAIYYFKSLINKEHEIQLLTKALHLAKQHENIFLYIVVLIKRGLYYQNQNQILLAIMNFLEAERYIALIFKDIPKNKQVHVYNNSFYHIAFDYVDALLDGHNMSLFEIKKHYVDQKNLRCILQLSHIKKINKNLAFKKDLVSIILHNRKFKDVTFKTMLEIRDSKPLSRETFLLKFLAINLLAQHYGLFILNRDKTLTIKILSSNYAKDVITVHDLIVKMGYNKIDEIQNVLNKPCFIIPVTTKTRTNLCSPLGFMVFIAQTVVSNFSLETKKLCTQYSNILAIILESSKYKKDASTDMLTGALTRMHLDFYLKSILKNATKNKTNFTIILFDLDKFKNINDTYGHYIGDKVLKAVVSTAIKELKTQQKIGRYGGEEFLITLPNTEKNEAYQIAENIRQAVEKINFDEQGLKITISLGIASYPSDGDSLNDLFLKADKALYKAKSMGRNTSYIWNPSINKKENFIGITGAILPLDELKYSKLFFAITELEECLKVKQTRKKMFTDLLVKTKNFFNADNGAIILKKNKTKYSHDSFQILVKVGFDSCKINNDLISSVINSKNAICQIDWSNAPKKNIITNLPEWNTIMSVPLLKNEIVLGAIYLATPEKKHEFDSTKLNLLRFFADVISASI